jgi:hypothetical protein
MRRFGVSPSILGLPLTLATIIAAFQSRHAALAADERPTDVGTLAGGHVAPRDAFKTLHPLGSIGAAGFPSLHLKRRHSRRTL